MNSIETELASELYRRCRRFTPRQRDAVKLLSAIGHNVRRAALLGAGA